MPKTIYDLSDEYNISVRKLTLMMKNGDLIIGAAEKRQADRQMLYSLKKGRPLTVEHSLLLYRNPDMFENLGSYEEVARKYMRSLGHIENGAIPENAVNLIYGAAISDDIFLDRFGNWMASVIPSEGCGYHYIGTRAMFSVPSHRFADIYKMLPRAILNGRRTDAMRGKSLTDAKSSKVSFFPKKISWSDPNEILTRIVRFNGRLSHEIMCQGIAGDLGLEKSKVSQELTKRADIQWLRDGDFWSAPIIDTPEKSFDL